MSVNPPVIPRKSWDTNPKPLLQNKMLMQALVRIDELKKLPADHPDWGLLDKIKEHFTLDNGQKGVLEYKLDSVKEYLSHGK